MIRLNGFKMREKLDRVLVVSSYERKAISLKSKINKK